MKLLQKLNRFYPFRPSKLGWLQNKVFERLMALDEKNRPEAVLLKHQIQGLKQQAAEMGCTVYFVKYLREALAASVGEPISVSSVGQNPTEDGYETTIRAQNWIFELLAVLLCDALKAKPAPNYVECSFGHTELGPLTVHIQKRTGKTPHQLRLEAEAELIELKEEVRKYLEVANQDFDANHIPAIDAARERLEKAIGFKHTPTVLDAGELEQL